MRVLILFIFLNFFIYSSLADETAEAMLLGSFHFSNPGLDYVKNKHQIDVATEDNQAYLIGLSERIATKFEPHAVLVECAKGEQLKLDQLFSEYLNSDIELPINESYQIGFRVAKKAQLERVVCFDEREVQWQGEALIESMPKLDSALNSEFQSLIAEMTEKNHKLHKENSLRDIFLKQNRKEFWDSNKGLYLFTNSVGAGESFVGADASASWWHRNFRMYANIQKEAMPKKRVLVIAGHGHIAILRDLASLDQKMKLIDAIDYL